jgi:hypothetical protein
MWGLVVKVVGKLTTLDYKTKNPIVSGSIEDKCIKEYI